MQVLVTNAKDLDQPVEANPVRAAINLESKRKFSVAKSPHVRVALVERAVETLGRKYLILR